MKGLRFVVRVNENSLLLDCLCLCVLGPELCVYVNENTRSTRPSAEKKSVKCGVPRAWLDAGLATVSPRLAPASRVDSVRATPGPGGNAMPAARCAALAR